MLLYATEIMVLYLLCVPPCGDQSSGGGAFSWKGLRRTRGRLDACEAGVAPQPTPTPSTHTARAPLLHRSGKEAGVVAGCRVTEGSIRGSLQYRVMRGGEAVHTGPCASLKRHKLEVRVGRGGEEGREAGRQRGMDRGGFRLVREL